ncbi:MAG TPA: hypothetical protein VGF99_19085, partial [Myxococcota bacterium]
MTCSPARNAPDLAQPTGAERCVFTSVLALGALFGMMISPCARTPMMGAFAVVGVPLLTFLLAAPTRLGVLGELRLFGRDIGAGVLAALCFVVGRRAEAGTVLRAHRADVEGAYAGRVAAVAVDPLRLHHARRLGLMGAALATFAGVGLPFFSGELYTFGDFPQAPLVFLLDLVVIGGVARFVGERMAIRLFEASAALTGGNAWAARARSVPLTTMLGAALGAVGGLVVLMAASFASGVESVAIFDVDFVRATFWFM